MNHSFWLNCTCILLSAHEPLQKSLFSHLTLMKDLKYLVKLWISHLDPAVVNETTPGLTNSTDRAYIPALIRQSLHPWFSVVWILPDISQGPDQHTWGGFVGGKPLPLMSPWISQLDTGKTMARLCGVIQKRCPFRPHYQQTQGA